MALITLTSDWKENDFYLAAVKGLLQRLCPEVSVSDISHKITPFNIAEAAYIVRNVYKYYPPHTIHLFFVASTVVSQRYIAVKKDNQYFLSADNGIIGLIFDETEFEVYRIIQPEDDAAVGTFPEISVMVPAAAQLSKHYELSRIGFPIDDYNRQVPLMAVIDDSAISSQIIHIDSYGNCVCNVNIQLFERIRKGRKFKITVKNKYNQVSHINRYYTEVAAGDMFAVFNSAQLLEIGINQANAAELLNIDTDTNVKIVFFD